MAAPANQVQLPHFAPTLETLLGDPGLASTVLSCLEQHEARALRAASKLACRAVATHPWDDSRTVEDPDFGGGVHGCVAPTAAALARWRACFPHARAVRVQRSAAAPASSSEEAFSESDLAVLRGVRAVSIYEHLTRNGLAHLRDAHRLSICQHSLLGDAAAHFAGVLEVCLDIMTAAWLQPEHARHLARVPTVSIDGDVRDAVIAALGGADSCVRTLTLRSLNALSSERLKPFAAAGRLRKLSLHGRGQVEADALQPLADCLEELLVYKDHRDGEWLTDAHLAPLAHLRWLELYHTTAITGACFTQLSLLEHVLLLDARGVTDDALAQLQGVRELNILLCRGLTGAALASLPALAKLAVIDTEDHADVDVTAALLRNLAGARRWPALQRLQCGEHLRGPAAAAALRQSLGAALRDARGASGRVTVDRLISGGTITTWERGPGVTPPTLVAWAAARVPPLRAYSRPDGAWWVVIPADGQDAAQHISAADWRGTVVCYVPATPAGTGSDVAVIQSPSAAAVAAGPAVPPGNGEDEWTPSQQPAADAADASVTTAASGCDSGADAGADPDAAHGRKRKRSPSPSADCRGGE